MHNKNDIKREQEKTHLRYIYIYMNILSNIPLNNFNENVNQSQSTHTIRSFFKFVSLLFCLKNVKEQFTKIWWI